jgi:hypothetical protein
MVWRFLAKTLSVEAVTIVVELDKRFPMLAAVNRQDLSIGEQARQTRIVVKWTHLAGE